jgi:hypothetical protein
MQRIGDFLGPDCLTRGHRPKAAPAHNRITT